MSWIITGKEAGNLGLLDQYGGAAAAYSLRNLSVYYTDPVVRVRRSSDNTEQDFTAAQITDGTLTAFCGAGDGFVRTWYDQSGNSGNATQVTNASQPKIVASGSLLTQSDKPVIRFDGDNDRFIRSSFTVSGFIFLIALGGTGVTDNPYQSLSQQLVITDNASPRNWSLRKSADGTVAADTSITYDARALVSARTLQNNMAIWVNSVLGAVDTQTNAFGSDTFLFGGGGVGSFNGDVHEFIIYNTDQSTNRAAIEASINAHYSIF